jgi:outer membrane protein OmpA-like peptidoglycan-associated protein
MATSAGTPGSTLGDAGATQNTEEDLGLLVQRLNDNINFQEQSAAIQDAAQKILKVLQALIDFVKQMKV